MLLLLLLLLPMVLLLSELLMAVEEVPLKARRTRCPRDVGRLRAP